MTHEKIASISEPWILLPFLYSRKKDGIKTEYGHNTAYGAISNLINNLPNGEADFYSALRKSILDLYGKLCLSNEVYFLDKTPRYYLIIPLIEKLFPDGKFIFLFRNPISILASFIEAFNNNTLKRIDNFERDLYEGPGLIANGYKELKQKSILIKYENLVTRPKDTISEILNYLEIEVDEDILNLLLKFFYSQKLDGLGDNLGARKYKNVRDNRDKWKRIINSKCRINIAKKYILRVDDLYMDIGNYSKDNILSEINALSVNQLGFRDYAQYCESLIIKNIKSFIRWKSYS